jgi:hypothetical protein
MPFVDIAERTGHKRGLEEGLRKGERKGKREGLLAGLEVILKVKFGSNGLLLLPEIRRIREPKKLEALLQAIDTAKTPDDIRAMWAK